MAIPLLTYHGGGLKAIELYREAFPTLIVDRLIKREGKEMLYFAEIRIDDNRIMMSDSDVEHPWDFSPAISLFHEVDSKEELTRISDLLSQEGKTYMPIANYGFSELFTWVEDKFGVNWQLSLGPAQFQ